MNYRYFSERALVSFLTYVIVDFIVHGLIIADYFWGELEDIARTGSEIKFLPLFLGMGYVAIVFTYFMNYVEENQWQHIIHGAWLGSLFIVPYHIINYAFFFNYGISLVIIDSIVTVGEFSIVGLVLFRYTSYRYPDRLPNNIVQSS